jgi:hypothetical protein
VQIMTDDTNRLVERRTLDRTEEERALPHFDTVGYREGMDAEIGALDEAPPDEAGAVLVDENGESEPRVSEG